MNIDNLGADQFMASIGEIAEAVGRIKGSKAGKKFSKDLALFRKTVRKDDGVNARTGEWLMQELPKCAPAFCAECGDDVYRILAACDGIGLDEYKAAFNPRKFVKDVADLAKWVSGNLDEVGDFFASA